MFLAHDAYVKGNAGAGVTRQPGAFRLARSSLAQRAGSGGAGEKSRDADEGVAQPYHDAITPSRNRDRGGSIRSLRAAHR